MGLPTTVTRLDPLALYQVIVETAHEGIWLLDETGRTTFANQPLADMLGCATSRLVGAAVFDFMDENTREIAWLVFERLEEGVAQRFESRLRRVDGTDLHVELSVTPLTTGDGSFTGAVAMVSDITERRESTAALRESEERFRRVFDESPQGGVIVSPDLQILRTNATFNHLLGYRADELVGRSIQDLTHPEDVHDGRDWAAQLFSGDLPSHQIDKRYLHKGGWSIVGRLTTSLVRDLDGQVLYGIGLIEDVTEAVESARTIDRQQRRLAMTLEAGRIAAWELDLTSGEYTMRDNLEAVYGIRAGADGVLRHTDFTAVVHPEDRHHFETVSGDTTFVIEFRILHPEGVRWVRSQGEIVFDERGVPTAVRGTSVDVTPQREASEVYRRTVEASPDAFLGVDIDGMVTDWNATAEEMFGWPAGEVLGQPLVERIFPPEEQAQHWRELDRMLSSACSSVALTARITLEAQHRDGRRFPIELSLIVVNVDGRPQLRGFAQDITERQAYERELVDRALADQHTGLPNRTLLLDRLQTAVQRIGGRSGPAALLFIDVDRFKAVNDSLGHNAGDALLTAIARRLRGAVRADDTVARHGGDEFIVLCEDLAHPHGAIEAAQRIFAAFEATFALGGRRHTVSVSIGIVHVDTADAHPEALIRDADIAMYQAKARGGGRYAVFDAALRDEATRRLDLEDDLRTALRAGEVTVAYQPVVGLDGGLVGMEALARWVHPERGPVNPAEFIPLAEETGLIVALGAHVLDTACGDLATWRRRPGWEHLTVSVNLSGRQLAEADLAGSVLATLRAHGLPPGALCLEITESMLMDDPSSATATTQVLHDVGIRLAVDDFGTGYSSLLYLRRFPVQILKLDQYFVAGLGGDRADRTIVGSMIELAHDLGLVAVAEGVERLEQLDELRALGCDLGQGYYWSKPVPAEAFGDLLDSWSGLGERSPLR